jgi:hypothetical protein
MKRTTYAFLLVFGLLERFPAEAAEQIWWDGGADNVWSTNAPNWDGGAVWENGNSAVFSGTGGVVDVSERVAVADAVFATDGYTIADADADGTLIFVGGPSAVTWRPAARAHQYGGGVWIHENGRRDAAPHSRQYVHGGGACRGRRPGLTPNTAAVLGAAGVGNETIVEDGATLDAYSAWSSNVSEDLTISGSGVGGIGALVNLGPTPTTTSASEI